MRLSLGALDIKQQARRVYSQSLIGLICEYHKRVRVVYLFGLRPPLGA